VTTDHFGDDVAQSYDESVAEMFDPTVVEATIGFLAELAGNGPVLEFGVGTGRVALPLSRRGLVVHGVDLSSAMIVRLKAKADGNAISVTEGDFATTRLDEKFSLVYLVFNTVMNLTTQKAQTACFENAAHHLLPGGRFVVEVGVPRLRRLPPGETVLPFVVTPTRLGFDEYDVASQGLVSHHYSVRDGRLEEHSIPFRYVWPSELDLMARIAGMHLVGRWADWDRRPFTEDSEKHVSVWERPRGY